MTAVITLARRSCGVRAVSTASVGPLMSGVKNVARKSAQNTTGHGGRNGRTHRGTDDIGAKEVGAFSSTLEHVTRSAASISS
jgi:hypothetical protein